MQYLYKYIALILAFLFAGVIKSSPLVDQMAFILAALIIFAIIYIVVQRRNASFNKLFSGNPPEIFFISSIIMFMIELTGGVDSTLYFLSYFLLFGLPLISTPKMSLLFTGLILLYYVPDLIRNFNPDIILKLGSILLLLPISYFLSNELMKRQRENAELKEKAEGIEKEAENLESENSDVSERKKLDDIIESAEDIEDKT